MACCADCPGSELISYKEAIRLVKKALQKGPYVDGFGLLRTLYRLQGDSEQDAYWATVLKQCYDNPRSPSIEPEFLVKEYYHKERGISEVPSLEKSSIFYENDKQ